ncbi:MAG TPA: urea ABC transporter ATP-binding subunit UrtE [Polyangia bacterium]|jgi:urea transport system ATP-binding protein|nr:urea ABC transporter ATP-binding subunit UrtE [Polyangia bacterium]
MLEISNVNQFYGSSHTLWDATLTVPAGGCVCLMGRNGVGKTTLLKSIMGLLPTTSGSIKFDGQELAGAKPERRARLGIGFVPQGREIFADLTVAENLRVALAAGRATTVPEKIFTMFPVLEKMMNRRGGDLSGGQQQQLAIGRALVTDPKLLILDEPTEGIQPNIVHEIGDVILKLNAAGLAVLLVEQKLPFARRVARTFCMMDRGHTVASGEIAQLDDDLVKQHLIV